jgi:hypothetical protein
MVVSSVCPERTEQRTQSRSREHSNLLTPTLSSKRRGGKGVVSSPFGRTELRSNRRVSSPLERAKLRRNGRIPSPLERRG